MKKSKILIAVLGVIAAVSTAGADGGTVDFDGIRRVPSFTENTLLPLSSRENREKYDDVEDVPKPSAVPSGLSNSDHSIINMINYSEQKKIGHSVVLNLKKLLILGTKEEKSEFINSSKYLFPQRFANFENARFAELAELPQNKGFETHCWEDNCRMVQVCNNKKSCERSCELLGVTCAAAGTAFTQYYTGGAYPPASAAVGGAAGLGCKWACDDWICDNIPDCYDVQKCDSHCETIPVSDGTEHIDPNTGQIIHS